MIIIEYNKIIFIKTNIYFLCYILLIKDINCIIRTLQKASFIIELC